MTDIKTLLTQYEQVNAELNKQIKENGKAFMESLFQEIFDRHEGLKVAAIVGYTPGFNDGDPCSHSHQVFTGYKARSWYDFQEEAGNFEEDFEYDEESKTCINDACKSLEQARIDIEIYDEIIERVYDTDFRIVITKGEDGKVSVSVDEYECGY